MCNFHYISCFSYLEALTKPQLKDTADNRKIMFPQEVS